MVEDEIRTRVGAFYKQPGPGVLMLSDLGAELRAASIWPIEGDPRSLATVVEETPGIVVVRHPTTKAFIVVAPEEQAERAQEAVRRQTVMQLLRRLPRPVLIAFCLDVDPEVPVYLRPRPPFRYVVGELPADDPDFIPVEAQFRIRGVFAEDVATLDRRDAMRLGDAITGWCDAHGLDPAELGKYGRAAVSRERASDAQRASKPDAGQSNALERLLAAQSPEIAARLIVPLDIAVALTRLR